MNVLKRKASAPPLAHILLTFVFNSVMESDSAVKRNVMTVHLPELLTQDQFLSDRLLLGSVAGELILKWAVFADGLKQYWKLAADQSCHDSEEFLEEERWVLAEDPAWPFSFSNLCETFGVQTDSVRHALLAWKHANRAATVTALQDKKPQRNIL